MSEAPNPSVPPEVLNPKLVDVRVYLGIPTYDERVHQSTTQVKRTASAVVGRVPVLHIESSSLLPRTFNSLYAAALNARTQGITHFCLMHEDVHPIVPGWLDRMLAIMADNDADVLSAIIPIKDERGITSTGIEIAGLGEDHAPGSVRRLTMTEVAEWPETFTDPALLVNTGLLLIDIRKPWAETIWFEFIDTIVRGADGMFKPIGISEDWNFSRKARAAGARIFATRAIRLIHRGKGEWRNWGTWGSVKVDGTAVSAAPIELKPA